MRAHVAAGRPRYAVADLFAGAGGLRLGFEMAFGPDAQVEFVSEWDGYARKTYLANFPGPEKILGDAERIGPDDLPPIDVCLASLPRPPKGGRSPRPQALRLRRPMARALEGEPWHSPALPVCDFETPRPGYRMGGPGAGALRCAVPDDGQSEDALAMPFSAVARVCAAARPKLLLCEGSDAWLKKAPSSGLSRFCDALAKMGYKTRLAALDSSEFGVAQSRRRVYLVAFLAHWDRGDFCFPKGAQGAQGARLRDVLEERAADKYFLSERSYQALMGRGDRSQGSSQFGFQIRDLEGLSGPMRPGGMGRERNLIVDPRRHARALPRLANREGVRKLTPRECARLQGFPDSFELPVSDSRLYEQLCKTATVSVARSVAAEAKRTLDAASVRRSELSDG